MNIKMSYRNICIIYAIVLIVAITFKCWKLGLVDERHENLLTINKKKKKIN